MSMFMPSLYSENSPTNFSLSAWSSMELENSQEHHSTDEWTFDDNKLMDNQELIESESSDHVSDNIKGKEVNETENPQTTERPKRPKKRGIPWTEEEHKLFLLGLQRYGKGEWKNISRYFVMTKTPSQVASHAQKFKNRMNSSTPLDKRRPSINDIKTLNDSLSSLHPKRNLSNFQSTTQKNPVPNALHRPVVDQLPPPYVYNNNEFYNVGYQENQNLVPNAFQPPVVDQLPPPHVYNNNNYYYPVHHQQHHNHVPDAFQLPTIDQLQTPDLYNNNYCYNVDYNEFGATSSNWRLNNGSFNSMTYQTWVNQQN